MPPFHFDKSSRQYVKPNGTPITPAEQRQMVLRITSKASDSLAKLTEQLASGKISTSEWAVQMKESVKGIHSAVGTLAHGGKKQMGARQLGSLGATIREQNKYLSNFINEVENGLSLEGAANRARMYADAGWVTYERSIAYREKAAGMTEERSILDEGSSHCEDCPAEAGKGWSEIGSLIPIGERACVSRCRCSLEYR